MKNSLFNDITGIFNKLAPAQKMLLGGVAVTSIILMIVLLTMLNEPNYSTLYSHLAPEDASKVIEELNTQKIPYKLEANGETIKVPKDNVYELRLSLAAKGVPNSGVVGYEIFDKTTIGMSEFMQKLNYRRALEGELARTIMQQDAVEAARVHLVFPKKAVFKEDEIEPTASVVIKEKGSRRLKPVNIEAIQNLVAGSVEGMNPNNVTVIDTKGRLLSKERGDDSFASSSSKQYEVKKNVEKYLIEKAQTILDNVLGAGNAIVQVDASLNFSQVEKQMEIYDPEGQVVVSEQTVKNSNVGHNVADSTANVSENVTTNYETGKTIQRVIEESGNIKKLSIAAVINHARKEVKEGDAVKVVYEPRNQEEIDKLAGIIRNAVGFDAARGDQLSIESVPFEPQMNEGIEMESPSTGEFFDINNMDKLINLIIVVFAIIASLFIMKGLLKKVKEEKILIGTVEGGNPSMAIAGGNPLEQLAQAKADMEGLPLAPKKKQMLQLGDLEDEISDEAQLKKLQHERITNYVSQNPVDAAKLINAWLHEDEYA